MGIIFNAASIFFGGIFGSLMKKFFTAKHNTILGISIMIISFTGVIESMFTISENTLSSKNLLPVVFTLISGTILGETLKINKNLDKTGENAFLTGSIFFGVGGLQISGPLLLALNNDSSQLILKSLVDFPFALALGATLGIGIAASCVPVALIQLIISFIAYMARSFVSEVLTSQICSLGYIILFFTGFNLVVSEKYKIDTVNMLPSIILIIFYNVIGVMI